MEQVKVYGFWASPYSRRVEIALKIKGVEYEYVEEEIFTNKSQELIQYNPVHKKVPVLLHNGKPIVESLVILEYIDETWKHNPILPSGPYERAQARFWAKFHDDKLMPAVPKALYSKAQGEEGQKLNKEAEEVFNILETQLKDNGKKFFGGDEIGFVDIVVITGTSRLLPLQEAAGKQLLTEDKFPALYAWIQRMLACNVIHENLPPKEKLLPFFQARIAAKNT